MLTSSSQRHHHRMGLAEAKQRVQIHDLWRLVGYSGEPRTSCRCPWREDRRPSFSVTPSGDLWHDFATGEGGDAVDFLQRARGLSRQDACRQFIELAGGRSTARLRPTIEPCAEHAKPKPRMPELRRGQADEIGRLAKDRNLSVEALLGAQDRGLLRFGIWKGRSAWFVRDVTGRNVQARRMDRRPWGEIEAKAWTLPGSHASWPIGTIEAEPYAKIALVEGAPDLLAAFHFDGLRRTDDAAVKDLCDLAIISADDFEAERATWETMP